MLTAIDARVAANPEYAHLLFDDADCAAFFARFGSAHERLAYDTVTTGAARADLFRLLFLREVGGVYTDTDCELREGIGLRAVVPRDASAVVSHHWMFDFFAFEPRHPVVAAALARAVGGVLRQAELLRAGSRERCKSAHVCVYQLTGPDGFKSGVIDATRAAGCAMPDSGHFFFRGPSSCANSSVPAYRRIHICQDRATWMRGWMCGIVRHRHCAGRARACGKRHWSQQPRGSFFRALPPSEGRRWSE